MVPFLIADAIDQAGQTFVTKIQGYGIWIAILAVIWIGFQYISGKARGHDFNLVHTVFGLVCILAAASLAATFFGGIH